MLTSRRQRQSWVWLAMATLAAGALLVTAQERQAAPRARVPKFDDSTTRVFFPDVFSKVVGTRPAQPNAAPAPTAAAVDGAVGSPPAGAYAWSNLISAATLENEVKSIKLATDKNVTTPTDFAGRGYKEIRRDFSIVAMVFAIISEYDKDVRWKNDAAAARTAFARTASNAKAGGNINVYNEAKKRKDDLLDLLNGSSLAAPPSETTDWEQTADRSPLMQRLETAAEKRLSPWTATADALNANSAEAIHEAELVAAISEVLLRDGMTDADDEDYQGFARLMQSSAQAIVDAVKQKDADRARQASGEIIKACADCHESYRG